MSVPKPLARLVEPLSLRIPRRRPGAATVLVPGFTCISLAFILFLYDNSFSSRTTPHTSFAPPPLSPTIKVLVDHISPAKTSFQQLVALSPSQRADALAHALDAWRSGPLPPAVSVAAAVCTTRDAADALLRGDLDLVAVLDIGPHVTHPVTTLALQRAARLVITVEPDSHLFANVAALPVSRGRLFAPIHAAVSETDQSVISRQSHDHTNTEQVNTSTVDSLFLDGDALRNLQFADHMEQTLYPRLGVRLLKTHTDGHETQVLIGAKRLFATGRVENVIVEFDVELLGTKHNALQTLQQLFEAGFSCTQLTFDSLTEEEKNGAVYPFFGRVAITNDTAERFYDFVKFKAKVTDILCSKR